ncbi:MAG: hypothetical protein AAEJ04_03050 [Planctomycetota bacterium]
MPKLNINLLRGGLLLLNIGALCLLTFTFYDLYSGAPEAVSVRLADPEDFSLREEVARPVNNQYQKIIADLYRKPPVVRTEPVQPAVDPNLPLLEGGPIGEWEITGVIVSSADGQRFATITEKGQTAVITSSRSSRTPSRTVNTTRVRGASSRTSTRGRTTRPSSRSTRAPVSNQRVRLLEQGKTFRIDENVLTVVEIDDQPKKVVYEQDGRRYTLSAADKIDPIIQEDGSALVLRGYSPEEILLLGGGTPVTPASTNLAIPGDQRGSIRNRSGQPVPGTEAKNPTPTAGGVSPGRPVPTTKSGSGVKQTRGAIPGRGGRGGPTKDRAVPSKKPTPGLRGTPTTGGDSRKQIEATLGIDLNDGQGAIRRLEELNRAQGQQRP